MKKMTMKRGSIIVLRLAIILIGLIGLMMCAAFVLLMTDGEQNYRNPIWAGLLIAAVPFYVALCQAFKLLDQIDKGTVFSVRSVKILRSIKYSSLAISGIFAAGSPYVFHVAQKDDAPGLFALGLIIIGASFVIAMAAAVFQRLLRTAADMKSENDLTV